MTTTHVFASAHGGEFASNSAQIGASFLLGVSERPVDLSALPSTFSYEKLMQAEAVERLAERIDALRSTALTASSIGALLDGIRRIRRAGSPLVADRRVQTALDVADRDARERAEEADRLAAQPRKAAGDYIWKKIEALEQRVADLETRLSGAAA